MIVKSLLRYTHHPGSNMVIAERRDERFNILPMAMTYDVYAHRIPGCFKSEVDDLDQMHPNAPQAHPKEAGEEIL